jgi:16S rRNA (uracil1498-N3)-methyltransferase
LRRFFVEKILPTEGLISITGKEARHITNVLRMKKGEALIIMDGKGQLFESVIEKLHSGAVEVKIIKSIPSPPSSSIEISLGQALIKSKNMDYFIQKTTELGIHSIHLFYSERTVIRLKPDNLAHKIDRWNEIIKSACKQCGRSAFPIIYSPIPFKKLIKKVTAKSTLKLLVWEDEQKTDLKNVFKSMSPSPHIMAIVGPEGGFTVNEIKLAREAGFRIVSLGKRILRSETAGVTLASIIQYEWGDLGLRSG